MATAEEKKEAGNAAFKQKDWEKACALYTEAIELDPKNNIFYCNRAAAYIHQENYEKAIKDCVKSIELEPTYLKGYLRFAQSLEALKEYDQALKIIEKTFSIGKDSDKVKKELRKLGSKIKRIKANAKQSNRQAVAQALMSDTSRGTSGNTADIQKLQNELFVNVNQRDKLGSELRMKQNDIKVRELTMKSLGELLETDKDAVTYQACGRMFMKKENVRVQENLKQTNLELENELKSLKKAQDRFASKITETEASMRELMKNRR